MVEKGRFDGLVAGGEHELELRAVLDVGANDIGWSVDGVNTGEPGVDAKAMKVEVGGVGEGVMHGEDAEGDASPGFGVEGVVEIGVAREQLAIEVDGERVVTGGAGEDLGDGGEVLGGCEGDLGAARIGLDAVAEAG